MDIQQVQAYFARIGMEVPTVPTADALRDIQLRHVLTVPFENLDVMAGRVPLKLDTDSLFDKVVVRKRGGICYELNLLLADMLESVGYQVERMGAMHPKYGNPFDHAMLAVTVPQDGSRWFVDVGFADNFRVPLPFVEGEWMDDGRDRYILREVEGTDEGRAIEFVRERDGEEALMYTIVDKVRSVAEYQPRADWYGTSEISRFTQGPLVCLEHEGGRVSLTMNRVLNTYNGERVREDIDGFDAFEACLREVFGIELEEEMREALREAV